MWLRILWLLLILAAFTNATALTSESEEDVSIEDPSHPQQPFYDARYDSDDSYYYKNKYKKPAISEDAIFLPHEKYCQYFYAFDGSDSHIFRCPSGYRFDVEKLQCLKSKQVSCGKRKKDVGSSEEKHVGLDFKCPNWSGAHPHKHYCHLFYYCQNKKPSLFMCPPGKLFDKKSNRCLPQNQVKCEKRENPYEDDDPEDISQPDPESNIVFQCPDKAGTYPDLTFCHKYIRCWYGIGELYVCPKGKLYDEDLKRCKSKNSVYCYNKINPYAVKDDEEPTLLDEYPDVYCLTYWGRYPHEECRQFYQCDYGRARLFQCPHGKRFDSESSSCRPESEVTCNKDTKDEDIDDEFVCPAREGTFKDEENCGSYYKCKKGKAQHLQCPEGELFDTDWKSCSDESQVTCGDRSLPGDDEAGDEEESVVDENPKYNCEKRHGRFTHKDYCSWFYHCKDGKPSVRSCKKGKYYDSYRRNCYDEVDCGSRKPKPDYEITTPKPREFFCPFKSGKFPDPRDCGAYYVCEKYKYKLHQCPKGKLFHDKWLTCSDENLVTCDDRTHPEVDPEDRENKVIDPNPKFECKAKYGQYDHEDYCDWYYNCHDSKPTLRECRRGKYYDSHKRKCHHSKEVSCGRRRKPEERENPTTTEKTIITRPDFQCPQSNGKFPHWRDCSKFYDCKKWTHKEHKCPKHKLFDSRRQSCEDDDHVICDERIHPDMDPDEPEDKIIDPNPKFTCKNNYGRFTHDEYCHRYYNCHNRKATVRECRHGRYYDSRRRKCYDSREVSCEGRKKPDDDENLRTTTEVYNTPAPRFQCPKGEGRYPHERNCGKYYECRQWRYSLYNCPKKQLYNEKSKRCENEEKVTCDSRIHPEDDPDEPEDKIVDPNPNFDCPSYFGRYDHRNCDMYYHCKDRRPSVRECRRGKYYDRHSRKCKHSVDVDCEDRTRPEDRVTYIPEKGTTSSQQTSTTTKEEVTTTKQPIVQTRSTEAKEIPKETPKITSQPEISTTEITEEPISTEFDDNPDKIIDREPNYDCAGDEGNFAHESYCHYYYSCQKNKVTLRECPEGKYFDIERGYCEDWYMVSCGDRLTPEELGSTFDEFQSTPYIERRRSTIIDKTTTEEPVSVKPKFDCPNDGLYPHEKNCAKYYSCINGVAEEKLCPSKQLFDVEKKACNEEQETNCGKRIHPNDHPDDPNKIPDKVIDPNPKFDCTSRHGCFSHEMFCKWYYYCHDKRPEVRECSGDQYFDSVRNKCLDWWMVFCDNRTISEDPITVPTTPTGITSSRNTEGPIEKSTKDTAETDSSFITNEDQRRDSTIDNQDTTITKDDREEKKTTKSDYGTGSTSNGRITESTVIRTRPTDSNTRTLSTRDGNQDPESTSSDTDIDSTKGRTRTTDSGKVTRYTREENQGTGSTPGQTRNTDSDRSTRFTRENDQSTRTTSSSMVTSSTKEGSIATEDRDTGIGSTKREDEGTESTIRNIGSTNKVTTESSRGTISTREDQGKKSTESDRVTNSRKTTESGRTRSTRGRDQGTKSTESDRVTGSRKTTESSRRTRSTRGRDQGTKSTPSGKITDSTDSNGGRTRMTDSGKGTRFTEGEQDMKSTPSGRFTGSTGGRTRTDSSRETYSTKGDQGIKSTPSGRFTGSTDSSRETYSKKEDRNTRSTLNDRVTDSNDGRRTDSDKRPRSTREEDKFTTPSGRVTDSTKGDTKTSGTDSDTRSTKTGDQITSSTPSDRFTGPTDAKPTENGKETRSTRGRDKSTSSTPSDRVAGSTDGRTSDRYTRTRSTIEGNRDKTTGIYITDKPIIDKCKEEDGDFYDPDDCSKYYTCKDGEYSINDCPSGMMFDKNLRICAREDRVDCDNRRKPEVTTDDCDEWLRTSTTADNLTTQPRKGTTGPNDKGTGGTATANSEATEEITTINSQNTGSTTNYVSDETDVYTESDSPSSPDSNLINDPTKDTGITDFISDSTNSDSVSENFSGSTSDNVIASKTSTTSEDNTTPNSKTDNTGEPEASKTSTSDESESTIENLTNSPPAKITTDSSEISTASTSEEVTENDVSTKENSSKESTDKEPRTEEWETRSTNFQTQETTEISDGKTDITDGTISTDDNEVKSKTTSTTRNNESEDSTVKTVTIFDPTLSTSSESGINTDSSEIPTSTNNDIGNTKTTSTTRNNESEDSTVKTVTVFDSTLSTSSESGINTDSSDIPTSTNDDIGNTKTTYTTKGNESGKSTVKTVTMLKPTISTNSESEENTDATDKGSGSTIETSSIDSRKEITKTTSESDSSTDNKDITEDERTESPNISESELTTDDKSKTDEVTTAESSYTSVTNEKPSSIREETSSNPPGRDSSSGITESTIVSVSKMVTTTNKNPISTTNDGATDDDNETLETRIIGDRTPLERETPIVTSTQSTEDAIGTKEVSSSTENLGTDNLRTESDTNTDDNVSEITSTTINNDETTSAQTRPNEDVSTATESGTTEHTTMHPCLTHTHGTAFPTEPTKINCDSDDIDCIERKTGGVEKWYRCPTKEGFFPHPHSNRIFIRCKNSKPEVKRCGRRRIFSTKYMQCIHTKIYDS